MLAGSSMPPFKRLKTTAEFCSQPVRLLSFMRAKHCAFQQSRRCRTLLICVMRTCI